MSAESTESGRFRRNGLQIVKQLRPALAHFRQWHGVCCLSGVLRRFARPFIIKTRLEAYAVIYALAVGAAGRGFEFMSAFPGTLGYLLFAACLLAVLMGGAKIIDATRPAGVERRRAPTVTEGHSQQMGKSPT